MDFDIKGFDKFDKMVNVVAPGESGVAKIDHFEMSPIDEIISQCKDGDKYVPRGRYARLKVNNQVMMVDTPMEHRTNVEVVLRAEGRVLIAGLGLGMILHAILRKPSVTEVVVLEKYQDVYNLVKDSLPVDSRLKVVIADVSDWSYSGPKFNVIYFDIWPNSNQEHIPEMERLHKQYRPHLARGGWISSWTYKILKASKKQDKLFTRRLPGILKQAYANHSPEEFLYKIKVMLFTTRWNLNDQEKQIVRDFAAKKGMVI